MIRALVKCQTQRQTDDCLLSLWEDALKKSTIVQSCYNCSLFKEKKNILYLSERKEYILNKARKKSQCYLASE